MRTYESLGRDKPYQKPITGSKENGVGGNGDKTAGRPLSPPDNGSEIQQSIDAKMEKDTKNGIKVERSSQDPPGTATARNTASADRTITAAPKAGRSAAGRKKKADANPKPYEGLFDITLRLAESPSVAEIHDLRKDVKGGEKTWIEPLVCLVCGAMIS